MNTPIEFETPRLLLRQWRAADHEPFAALNADPIVMAYFPEPLTREKSDAIADRCKCLIAERGWGAWATEIKATGEFIGFVGLHIPQDDLPVSPCVEILWRLAQAHWRQGFATEAARGALHIGFEVLGLATVCPAIVGCPAHAARTLALTDWLRPCTSAHSKADSPIHRLTRFTF